MRGTKLAGVLGVSVTTLLLAGAAGAESAPDEGTSGSEVRELAEVGSQLKEAQDLVDATALRTQELEGQTRKLNSDLGAERKAAKDSQARFEERVRATYKGQDLAGVSLVVESLFGDDGARLDAILDGPAARVLFKGRGSIRFHKDSQRTLEETSRQLAKKKAEYEKSRREQQERAEDLRRREAKLKVSVGKTGSKKEQMEVRIAQLQAAEEAGGFTLPPASGGSGTEMREQELEIAQEDIVVRPVEPIPRERYVQIYKEAAERYRFAENWHVLAAVGKVESNHGENMGPSSAGAMGPMQFLPSTWQAYGVDGNGDGEANIMDPEDAIPAAARYLKVGGAPKDWYAALFTYNRAGWYVREVLGIAEAYRRQARDEVEPYV